MDFSVAAGQSKSMYHSKPVTSDQPGVHRKLKEVVLRHLNSEYQKPIQRHNRQAFEEFLRRLERSEYSILILDSCCGTGMSSKTLASANPNALVVGVDQSGHRLSKANSDEQADSVQPDNCLLLRANCEDFWRLCVEHQIQFELHFILYPNPWPKPLQLKRRWHAHPVFPWLKPLAKQTEVRSNWAIYLQEFSQAWDLLTGQGGRLEPFTPESFLTLFEKKYANSQQQLYRLQLDSGS